MLRYASAQAKLTERSPNGQMVNCKLRAENAAENLWETSTAAMGETKCPGTGNGHPIDGSWKRDSNVTFCANRKMPTDSRRHNLAKRATVGLALAMAVAVAPSRRDRRVNTVRRGVDLIAGDVGGGQGSQRKPKPIAKPKLKPKPPNSSRSPKSGQDPGPKRYSQNYFNCSETTLALTLNALNFCLHKLGQQAEAVPFLPAPLLYQHSHHIYNMEIICIVIIYNFAA